jgi:protein-tyrosine phosphatase
VYGKLGRGNITHGGPRAGGPIIFIKSGQREFSGNMAMSGMNGIRQMLTAPGQREDPGAPGIVVLCTGNVCRSPMAAALLARQLADLSVTVPVSSAGTISSGDRLRPEVISVMASYGIQIASHRSRLVCAADLASASLVLAMARDNLRHAAITEPEAWPRAFTLKELVRRGEQIGPRPPGEPLSGWLSRVHAGRERTSLLGDSLDDDVADPVGGPLRAYADTAGLLDHLVTRLAVLGWGHAEPHLLTARWMNTVCTQ